MPEDAGRLSGTFLSVEDDLAREFEARLVESSTLAFRVAFGVLRQRQDAEDVAQEALAIKRLMRGLDQGVVEPSAAGDGPTGVQPIQPPIPIVIAPMAAESPITIAPLGIPAPERGVRQ
jgi:hypothetical protein